MNDEKKIPITATLEFLERVNHSSPRPLSPTTYLHRLSQGCKKGKGLTFSSSGKINPKSVRLRRI
jgi:hypothetical protein